MSLPKPAYVSINGNRLTDQGRSEVSIDTIRIENSQRTVTGQMRRQSIAIKHNFSFSYEMVPAASASTVDENAGGDSIISLLKNNTGTVTLALTNQDLSTTSYACFISSFEYNVKYRWDEYYYDISIVLEEV